MTTMFRMVVKSWHGSRVVLSSAARYGVTKLEPDNSIHKLKCNTRLLKEHMAKLGVLNEVVGEEQGLIPELCCAPGESRSQHDDATLPGEVKPQDAAKDILKEFMENI
ncbi:Uncharacterized protein Rs2_04257 [Raphanus sativus]|nr:Uncharacterized protein Rs2_04257 [Raphanus sativus]